MNFSSLSLHPPVYLFMCHDRERERTTRKFVNDTRTHKNTHTGHCLTNNLQILTENPPPMPISFQPDLVLSVSRARLPANTSRSFKRSSAWYWWPPSSLRNRRALQGWINRNCWREALSIDIIRVTLLVLVGGDNHFLKNRESHSELYMCGMSTHQWPNTRITFFDRTRQSAWLDAVDDTTSKEASEFLCIKTHLFLREFTNKKFRQNPPEKLSPTRY